MSLLTRDKVTEIFCIVDDFCKEFSKEMKNVRKRNRYHPAAEENQPDS
jgi:hypothetical protein